MVGSKAKISAKGGSSFGRKNQKSPPKADRPLDEKEVKQQSVVTGSSSGQIVRGRVVAAKIPASVTVLIERRKVHPLYQKSFIKSKKYLVHDPFGVSEGDIVDIAVTRPISKKKHFVIVKVIGKDIEAIATQQLKKKTDELIAEVMPEEKETVVSSEKKDEKQEKSKKKKGENSTR